MPIEWTRAATDHLIRQRRILLSGEMEEVEVTGPEQASVTIGLSEADSGSSPVIIRDLLINSYIYLY
ncbi:uncharacterized protein OCT59_011580 [Rhizophagus irregularis]|uniref:uncharacterized protein n=1 Tax=Rhizophagus irregularis TaxID=588596 RepID=UPI00331DA772|nr:hypothetical protein OCT59_011580 [Rhizophagus irregularis]